jgi:5'-nucleotidase
MKSILIDMDDTICDFTTAYKNSLEKDPKIGYPQSQYGFFMDLEPIDGAKFYISLLAMHFEIHIVTRPSIDNLMCYTEKATWIRKHFGRQMLHYTTMTCHKHKFEGDYLIDDSVWPLFKGEQIVFGMEPFTTWQKVWHYIANKEGIMN